MRSEAQPWGMEVVEVKRSRHTPDQIVRKLREADRLLAEGCGRQESHPRYATRRYS